MTPHPNRYENVYMVLSTLFLGTLGIVNVLGLSRIVDLSFTIGSWTLPMAVPLGVLPYPLTFLCTDIVSEFYGRARANQLVWMGFMVNVWIFFLVWLGGALPSSVSSPAENAFFILRSLTLSSIFGSMIAYLIAQLLDVHVFHFCKSLTNGKHLWFRNNVSTLLSQFIDTLIVMGVAYAFSGALLPKDIGLLIMSAYTFKVLAALIDTIPFYLSVSLLKRYLHSENVQAFSDKNSLSYPS